MGLHRIDNRPIPRSSGECRAFMVCNNEAERLPYLFDYHRHLGVHRFIVVDNNSNDGSYDFLASQPDCHLFHTAESFAAANHGVKWLNSLLEEYGPDHWCLVLDADELFVYPYSEEISLPEFCAYLDRSESQGVVAYLLDMYSRCPIFQAKYTPGTPLLDTCPYFDRDYLIRSRFGFSVGNWPWPDIEVVGGPRLRCFYSGFQGASRIRTNLPKAVRLAKRSGIGRSLRIDRLQLGSDVPPLLTKVPLVKGVNGH
jgi:glycosyltransferase involved in cell wall biosynthesis